MFENAGTKIKNLASGLFILGVAITIIAGIAIMVNFPDMAFMGLLVVIGGFVGAYLTALFLSAFGELVESTTENKKINAEILKRITLTAPQEEPRQARPTPAPEPEPPVVIPPSQRPSHANIPNGVPAPQPNQEGQVFCPVCGTKQPAGRKVCWDCGVKFQ